MVKRVTREDVAKKAGVSVAAVSRALNNSGYIKKEKKEYIIEIATQMGYNPNPIATSLQMQRTRQIMVFISDLTGAFHIQMFHGIVRAAQKRNYRVLLDMQCDYEKVKQFLVDGIIFPNEVIAEKYARDIGRTYHLPTVTISYDPAAVFTKPMPCVLLDDREVINRAIDYLKKMGHRRIGIAVPFMANYAKKRYCYWKERMEQEQVSGFEEYAVNAAGYPVEETGLKEDYQTMFGDFVYYDLFEKGRIAASMYAEADCKATAMICYNDDMAHGMIQELEKRGIHVPEQVSIMGIDGTYIRSHFPNRLTSVTNYPDQMGANCVNVLLDILEDKPYKYINWGRINILEGDTVKNISGSVRYR